MPLVSFFSVLELPEKNRKGVATTPPPWLDEGSYYKQSLTLYDWDFHSHITMIGDIKD